jgi:hypothetical protein
VPDSLRAWVNMQSGDEQYQAWGDLLHTVKTGETAFNHVFGMNVWQYRAHNPEQAKIFDGAMANQTVMYNTAVLSSYRFSGFKKLLTWEVATAASLPQLSKLTRDQRHRF